MALFNFGESINPLMFASMATGGQQGGAVPASFNPYAVQWSNPSAANALLAPYGLSVPQSLPHNFLFPGADSGQGFWGHHAGVANMLQAGLLNAAATPPPNPNGEGWGQGFSRAVQGILGGPQIQQTKAMQSMMAPFAMTDTLSGVSARQAMNTFYRSYGQSAQDRAAAEEQAATNKAMATRPGPLGANAYDVFNPGTKGWDVHTFGDGNTITAKGVPYTGLHLLNGVMWGINNQTHQGEPVPGYPAATPSNINEAIAWRDSLPKTDPRYASLNQTINDLVQTNATLAGSRQGATSAAKRGEPGYLNPAQKQLLNSGQQDYSKELSALLSPTNPVGVADPRALQAAKDQLGTLYGNWQTLLQNGLTQAPFGAYLAQTKWQAPNLATPGAAQGSPSGGGPSGGIWSILRNAMGLGGQPSAPTPSPADPLGLKH